MFVSPILIKRNIILNSVIRKINVELQELCKKYNFNYISNNEIGTSSVCDDGLHLSNNYCMNSFRIRSDSGLYFSTFGLNTERYEVSLPIQSECAKMQTRITPNTDTFHAVNGMDILGYFSIVIL